MRWQDKGYLLSINKYKTAKTRSEFAIFEPMIFPKTNPPKPSNAALIPTKSSGADVPNATIVTPITAGDTARLKLSTVAARTSKSPLTNKTTIPTVK